MRDRLELLFDTLTLHFSQRRDALDVISRFGHRFEHWMKWEAAVALHVASFTSLPLEVQCVDVERTDGFRDRGGCDLFVGSKPWGAAGEYPAEDDLDLWLELKARSNTEKGANELADDVFSAQSLLESLKRTGRKGRFATLALVVGPPKEGRLERIRAYPHMKAPKERLIWEDARAAKHDDPDRLLAALLLWEVEAVPA